MFEDYRGKNSDGMFRSDPVRWWELINEAEYIRKKYGLGLANVWECIHKGDYDEAKKTLKRTRDANKNIGGLK